MNLNKRADTPIANMS